VIPGGRSNFKDYDAAFAEEKAEPLIRRLYGKDWTLPAVLPAAVTLKVARWNVEGRAREDLSEAEVFDLAADIVPADTLTAWTDKGLSTDRLAVILMDLIVEYAARAGVDLPSADPDAEGNAPTTPSEATGLSA